MNWNPKTNHNSFLGLAHELLCFEAGDVEELVKEIWLRQEPEVKDITKLAVYYISLEHKGEIFSQSARWRQTESSKTQYESVQQIPQSFGAGKKFDWHENWRHAWCKSDNWGLRWQKLRAIEFLQNSPLKFVVMTIENQPNITEPRGSPKWWSNIIDRGFMSKSVAYWWRGPKAR